MSQEPNAVETNSEPTLENFNQGQEAQPAAAQQQPASTDANTTAKASDVPADGQQPAGQAAQKQSAPEDPYAHVAEGLQMPQGVEVDKYLLQNVKEVAKQYNISADAVKALIQLDVNNAAAEAMAEDRFVAEAQAKWQAENQAKYGDNLKNVETNCSRVLAELDKEGKFKELLATAGVTKHPATLGFLKTIGDLYLEKPSVNPNATVSTDEEVELENFN